MWHVDTDDVEPNCKTRLWHHRPRRAVRSVRLMKFGIMFANTGPFAAGPAAVELARHAEDLGFESLWTVEHVVVPTGYQSTYPYSPTGRMPGDEANPIPDPLVWLAYVAGATTTIRLATGILILPQRNPLVLAKEVATLDAMSGGRVELGIGVGWLREEFDALGVPFDDRAARTDEYVEILRRVWREPATRHDGTFTRFAEVQSYPKPTRIDGPPIHVGGHSLAAARRAGRIGDGFFPGRDLDTLVPAMRSAAEAAGRDPSSIVISAGGKPGPATVEHYRDTYGVQRFLVPPLGADVARVRANLDKFADRVIARL